nr:YjbQ family protein [Pectinatus frisingensis]
MTVYKETIALQSHGERPTFINITSSVKESIKKSQIQNGICTIISPHTTCAVFLKSLCTIMIKMVMNFYR